MINTVDIKNFKGIQNLKVENLNRINLFIGNNNTNKTSLLESIYMGMPNNFSGGFDILISRKLELSAEIFTNFFNKLNTEESINIEIAEGNNIVKTIISKSVDKNRIVVSNPQLKANAREFIADYQYKQFDKKGNVLSDASYAFSENNILEGKAKQYHAEIITKKKKNIVNDDIVFTSCKNSNNKVLARHVKETLLKNLRLELLQELQKFDDSILDILADDNNIHFGIKGIKNFLPINSMGDGISTVLDIIISLLSNSNYILIDELEVGLYYENISKISQFIMTKLNENPKLQVFITTHSSDVIKIFSNISDENIVSAYRLEKIEEKIEAVEYSSDLKFSVENEVEIR